MQRINLDKNVICTYGSLVLGVILGCTLLLISIIYTRNQWLSFSLEEFDITVILNLPQEKLVFLILKKRILQLMIYFMLTVLMSYRFASFLYTGVFGCYYGIVICNFIIKYGINGLCFGIACFFPHYLLYFIIIYLCGKKVNIEKDYSKGYYKNINMLQFGVYILMICLIFFVALSWEINFQKNILNYFFQHLV